jgi:hypothetical protein
MGARFWVEPPTLAVIPSAPCLGSPSSSADANGLNPDGSLSAGDVVEIPCNVVHWHGAAPDSEFAHIAVSLNTDEGGAVWIGPVTDEEYERIN